METFQILLQHLPNMFFKTLVELYIDDNTIHQKYNKCFALMTDDNNNSQLNGEEEINCGTIYPIN